jgi:hypothetical protein
MAQYVPLSKRRDLKRPAWLRLEPDGGYPHLVVRHAPEGGGVFGPFRDTRAAARARDAIYKHFRIRPCDFDFKPITALPDGLTAEVSRALAGGASIAEIPAWVQPADGRSIVVERVGDRLELYPVQAGKVIDAAVKTATLDDLEPALARLEWTDPAAGDDDTPWLNAWRHGKRSGIEIAIPAGEPAASLAARVRTALGPAGMHRRSGVVVG